MTTSRQQFAAVATAAIMVVSMVAVGGLASISVFSSAEHPDALSDGVAEASHSIPDEDNLDSDEYLVDDDFEPGEVSDDDQLYPNISAAVSNANGGYTIYVREGTYDESVTVDKRLDLIGAGRDQVNVTGNSVVMTITGDNVMVHGFTFVGHPTSGDDVIRVEATSPSNDVKDLTFTQNRVIVGEDAHGIYHEPMDQGTNHEETLIQDNIFTAHSPSSPSDNVNFRRHVYIDGTSSETTHDVTIDDNVFTTPTHKGEHVAQMWQAVLVWGENTAVTNNEFDARANPDAPVITAQIAFEPDTSASNNVAANNTVHSNWAEYGVFADLAGAQDLTVKDNYITDAQEVGVFVNNYDGVDILRNDIVENHGPGVEVHGSSDVNVVANNVDSNHMVGVGLYDVSNANVHENDVLNTSGSVGIQLDDVMGASVTYNLLQNNTVGAQTLGQTADVQFRKNEFINNSQVGLDAASWDSNVTAYYNHFGAQDHDINNGETGPMDATLNWFGTDDTDIADMASVSGNVIYDPFLTDEPWDVIQQRDKTQAYAHDFTLKESTGPVHVIASPGPGDRTVGEAFEDLPAGTQLWAYDAQSDTWTMPAPSDSIDPLDAFVVTGLDNTRDATVVFGYAGDGASAPQNADIYEGWNLVGAPEKNDAEQGFQSTTATHTLVSHIFEGPKDKPRFTNGVSSAGTPSSWTHTVGTSPDECVDPYTGYWIFVDDDDTGSLPAQLHDGVSATDQVDILSTDQQCNP